MGGNLPQHNIIDMKSNWGWLGRDKTREHESSDEDNNSKYKRRSWANVAKRSLETERTVTVLVH